MSVLRNSCVALWNLRVQGHYFVIVMTESFAHGQWWGPR